MTKISLTFPDPVSSPVPLWQFFGADNPRDYSIEHGVGTPDVLPLLDRNMEITREWQWYIRALNPNMSAEQVSALLGPQKAFTNRDPSEPVADWILGENLSAQLPKFPKVFTCGYNCHSGRAEGNELIVTTLNGNHPPPDAGLVNPQSHPWFFFHATIVRVRNSIESRYPFPQGAAAWGYGQPYVYMPLVARFEVRVPLSSIRAVNVFFLPYT